MQKKSVIFIVIVTVLCVVLAASVGLNVSQFLSQSRDESKLLASEGPPSNNDYSGFFFLEFKPEEVNEFAGLIVGFDAAGKEVFKANFKPNKSDGKPMAYFGSEYNTNFCFQSSIAIELTVPATIKVLKINTKYSIRDLSLEIAAPNHYAVSVTGETATITKIN